VLASDREQLVKDMTDIAMRLQKFNRIVAMRTVRMKET
jgi:hypothetical protein